MLSRTVSLAYLLNKRLLLKPSYICLLLIFPILAFSLKIISLRDNSVLKIGLYNEGGDERSESIISELVTEDSIIDFISYEDEATAREELKGGLDALWILPENFDKSLEGYIEKNRSMIHIVESRESTLLSLAREKLFAKLYPYVSRDLYKHFIVENYPEELQDSELDKYYDARDIDDEIIEFVGVDDNSYDKEQPKSNFILSPLRAFLALTLLLIAFVTAIYYLDDTKNSLWVWIDRRRKPYFSLFYILISLLPAIIAFSLSLYIAGLYTDFVKEINLIALYTISIALLANILRILSRNIYVYTAFIPIILIISLLLSPVFIDVGMKSLQSVIPVYHYISALYSDAAMINFMLYSLVLLVLHIIIVRE